MRYRTLALFCAFLFGSLCVSAQTPSGSIVSMPTTGQSITQPIGTTLAVNSLQQEFWVDQYPGSDVGAKINYALANVCPTSGGYTACVLHLPYAPGGITQSTAVAITSPYVSIIGQGSGNTVINCTINSDCFRVYTNPFTIAHAGNFRGFSVHGNNGSAQTGVHLGDIVGSTWKDVAISGFGNGSCLLMDDADVGQGPSSGWTERNSFDQVALTGCGKLLRFIHRGGLNSFGYNAFNDMRMTLSSGETAVSVENDATPYHMTFNATINGPGSGTFNIFNIQDNGLWQANVMNVRGETGGSGCAVKQSGGGFFWYGVFTGFETFDQPSCYTGGGHEQLVGNLSPAPVGSQTNVTADGDVVIAAGSVLTGFYYVSYTGNSRTHHMLMAVDALQFNNSGTINVLSNTSYLGGPVISNPRIVHDSNSQPQLVVTLGNLNGGGILEVGFLGEIGGSQVAKLLPSVTLGTTVVATPNPVMLYNTSTATACTPSGQVVTLTDTGGHTVKVATCN